MHGNSGRHLDSGGRREGGVLRRGRGLGVQLGDESVAHGLGIAEPGTELARGTVALDER